LIIQSFEETLLFNTYFNFRSKRFWLLLLFLSYNLFALLLLPYIIKEQVGSVLKETAKWDTELQKVFFNPYTLALEIEGARIQEAGGKSIIEFDAFLVNFNLLKTLTGTISFDEISLSKPRIQLDIDSNGVSKFQAAFASEEETVTADSESSEPLALFFGAIVISQGQINISDNSQGENFKVSMQPLNLSLQDFSTADNEGGEYALSISIGKGQSLDWKGQLGIAPLQSKGRLSVNNIRSETFWHYVKKQSPFWLNNALVTLEGDYNFSMLNETTELVIQKAKVSLNDVALAEHHDSPDWLNLNSMTISPINFDLHKQILSLGTITLDTPEISLLRYPDNQINILKALNRQTVDEVNTEGTVEVEKAVNTEEVSQQSPFKWDLEHIVVNTGQFNWQDQSLVTPANLTVTDIEIKLGKIGHDLSQIFPYQINFKTDESTQAFSGSLSPDPFTLNGKLAVSNFPLTWLQSYLSESANIMVDTGRFSIESDYQLSQDDFLNAKISSLVNIDQLALKDTSKNKLLSGFEKLQIGPVDLILGSNNGLSTQDISIESIKLSKPFAEVYVSEQGELNLSQLSKAPVDKGEIDIEATNSPELAEIPSEKELKANEPTVQIETVEIQDGRFVFTDSSKAPVFNSYLDQVSGTITQLSSNSDGQSRVDISGNLESYGKLQVQGTLNPLGKQPNTDLDIKVSNIDLSTVSPYSAQYAGYLIDKGKLDLNLNYNIQDKKLDAKNHIFIDQFEFGESVDSEEATSLPLPFAIGMMKNLNGEIDIDLPISGDLDDPSFSLGGVILGAFTNLITKIVTSPFSILGALVEGGDDISSVSFLAASSELTSEQESKILKLAKALNERPNLNLEIRAVADESIDGQVDLLLLAKERSRILSRVMIDKGGIKKERIYMLEPQVLKSKNADAADSTKSQPAQIPTVLSSFTISAG